MFAKREKPPTRNGALNGMPLRNLRVWVPAPCIASTMASS